MRFHSAYLFAFLSYTASVLAGSTLPNSLAQLKSLVPDLLNADAATLTFGLKFGFWKSEDLVKAYTRRINEVSQLRAVLEINPDAIQIAKTLDQERKAGNVRGPLHGLPILIKDQIATKDKMNNSAGSFCFDGSVISEESFMAQKLRNAGAVILGKNSMSEFAGLRSVTPLLNAAFQYNPGAIPQGWCGKGYQGFSGYAQNLSPEGSSSGPAVAASLGLSFAALGTCTGGSIPLPAGRNNVVGIRPSVGLTSRFGVIPLSENRDTIGPMARTVSDAAIVLSAIAGKDPRDPLTLEQPFATPPNYVNALNKNALQGKRIGIPRNANPLFGIPDFDEPAQAAFENAISVIQSLGATIVNTTFTSYDAVAADLAGVPGTNQTQALLTAADFAAEFPEYAALLTTNPNGVTDVPSLTEFIQTFPGEKYPTFDATGFEQITGLLAANQLPAPGDPFYEELDQTRIYWGTEGGLPGAMQRDNLDAIILPSNVASLLPSLIGLPGISVPNGALPDTTEVFDIQVAGDPPYTLRDTSPNQPLGVTFFAEKWSEEKLIGFAYAYEQKTKFRTKVKPVVKPTTQLWNVIFGI